jgi:hypothetical protein
MPTQKKKKSARKNASKTKKMYIPSVTAQLATGMPAIDSVQAVVPCESPDGRKFAILRTNERDAYDRPPKLKKKLK